MAVIYIKCGSLLHNVHTMQCAHDDVCECRSCLSVGADTPRPTDASCCLQKVAEAPRGTEETKEEDGSGLGGIL